MSVLDILRSGSTYQPIGFIDADPKLANTRIGGLPVFGGIHLLNRLKQQHRLKAAIIAIGDNRTRAASPNHNSILNSSSNRSNHG